MLFALSGMLCNDINLTEDTLNKQFIHLKKTIPQTSFFIVLVSNSNKVCGKNKEITLCPDLMSPLLLLYYGLY